MCLSVCLSVQSQVYLNLTAFLIAFSCHHSYMYTYYFNRAVIIVFDWMGPGEELNELE